MMNSIAPFWDGNETWLIMGGGGLFAAFPIAYSIIMPAVYLPIIFMLLGLIFRGVAFEFRFKAYGKQRKIWDTAFHGGSLLATFMQGIILGNVVQGLTVQNQSFAGGPLDWANGFAVMCGLALISGYILLGSTWLIMKTEGETQAWARKVAKYAVIYVVIAMGFVSISMPFIDERIKTLWFSLPNFFYLLPIPLLTIAAFSMLWIDLRHMRESRPFYISLVIFFLGFLGLGISLYPWIVPYQLTFWEAAAAPTSQSLLLVGTAFFLPLILLYTGYCYYTFRGKSDHRAEY